jgi:hypothetical protein
LYITAVEMDETRACVIKIDSDMGSFEFACVYMLFDEGDAK